MVPLTSSLGEGLCPMFSPGSAACGAHIHGVSSHQVMSVVGLLRTAVIIAGLADNNGSSPPGL